MENPKNDAPRWSLPTIIICRATYIIERLPDKYVVRINIPPRSFTSEEEANKFIEQIQYKNL